MAVVQNPENTISLNPPDKLDASNSRQLIAEAKVMRQQGARQVTVDMSQIKLISNCGLLALNVVVNQLNDAGLSPLRLLNMQPHIKQALDVAKFHDYTEIYS